jgi:hypothetical protein
MEGSGIMYQLGVKTPLSVLSVLVYFWLPPMLCRTFSLDIQGDFLFDFEKKVSLGEIKRYERHFNGTIIGSGVSVGSSDEYFVGSNVENTRFKSSKPSGPN